MSLGENVVTIRFHDVITGMSVIGVLHMLNNAPIDCHSKNQSTIETVTYGSEHSSARTFVEQILDLLITLRFLGVHVRKIS